MKGYAGMNIRIRDVLMNNTGLCMLWTGMKSPSRVVGDITNNALHLNRKRLCYSDRRTTRLHPNRNLYPRKIRFH